MTVPKLRALGFALLRTPLLPVEAFSSWGAAADGAPSLEEAEARLRAYLRAQLERPEVELSLAFASKALRRDLATWRRDPTSAFGARLERALVKYFTRMSTRPTPFGTFAGCTTARVEATTRLDCGPRAGWRLDTFLDVEYVSLLAFALARDPSVRPRLRFRVNSTAHREDHRLRYVRTQIVDGKRDLSLQEAALDEVLAATLEAATEPRPLELLAATLARDLDCGEQEALSYLEECVESQVLVSELEPAVTGRDPTRALLSELAAAGAGGAAVEALSAVGAALARLDATGLEEGPAPLVRATELVAQLPDAGLECARVEAVLTKPNPAASVGRDLVEALQPGLAALVRCAPEPGPSSALERFAEAFERRYEGRRVPLLEVLDPSKGLGLQGTRHGEDTSVVSERVGSRNRARSGTGYAAGPVLRGLEEALRSGARELRLTEADLPEPPAGRALPATVTARLSVLARSAGPAPASPWLRVHGFYGPSALNLLGRFGLYDAALARELPRVVEEDRRGTPGALLSEIAHVPQGRAANVVSRPTLTEHEIPLLASVGSGAHPIELSALEVDVVDGEVRLYADGVRVVPRLGNAHDTSQGLPAYDFLSRVGRQGVEQGFEWSWGALAEYALLPRVSIGACILSPTTWRLERRALPPGAPTTACEIDAWVEQLRAARGLPRWVSLAEDDLVLQFDLDNGLSRRLFVEEATRRPVVRVQEALSLSCTPAAAAADGHYAHELLLPMSTLRAAAAAPAQPRRPLRRRPAPPSPRFPPFSSYTFLKLYASPEDVDELLLAHVAPFCDAQRAQGLVQGWFFVRYADPEWHLRVRLHLAEGADAARLDRALRELLGQAAAWRVPPWRVQLDTYAPEIHRYGGPAGVALAERVFSLDSAAAVTALSRLAGSADRWLRWAVGLVSVSELLGDLGLAPGEQEALSGQVSGATAPEFGKAFRPREEQLLAALEAPDSLVPGLTDVLTARRAGIEPLRPHLAELVRSSREPLSLAGLAGSYAHMAVNRLFRHPSRACERFVHYALARHLARRRRSPRPVP